MNAVRLPKTESNANEFFPTPEWVTHRLLDYGYDVLGLEEGIFLEPAFGSGAIPNAFDTYKYRTNIEWYGVEKYLTTDIKTQLGGHIIEDDFTMYPLLRTGGLHSHFPKKFDTVITNPPFSLALDFLKASLLIANQVIMLLPVSWICSEKRADILRRYTPTILALPNRPSFDGEGTNMADYGWYVWDTRAVQGVGGLRVLDSTPEKERR